MQELDSQLVINLLLLCYTNHHDNDHLVHSATMAYQWAIVGQVLEPDAPQPDMSTTLPF